MMTASWAPMMAAMMLPTAVPAIVRRDGLRTAPLFAGAYFAIWVLAALAIYAVYQPPGPAVAVALIAAGAVYELSPLARACRERCRAERRSGARYGGWCVGSTIGLMAVLVAIDPMSLPLMCTLTAVVLIQKELFA